MIQGLKQCRACGRTLVGNRLYCQDEPCQRAASAARKARQRARAKHSPQEPSEVPQEGFLAPWGQVYESQEAAVGDMLMTGGLDGQVTRADQEKWARLWTVVNPAG